MTDLHPENHKLQEPVRWPCGSDFDTIRCSSIRNYSIFFPCFNRPMYCLTSNLNFVVFSFAAFVFLFEVPTGIIVFISWIIWTSILIFVIFSSRSFLVLFEVLTWSIVIIQWIIPTSILTFVCPIGRVSRIHWLFICRGVRPLPTNEWAGYDTK